MSTCQATILTQAFRECFIKVMKVSTKLLVLGVPGYQLTKLKPSNLYHPTEAFIDPITDKALELILRIQGI